jgi:hypothetical protein
MSEFENSILYFRKLIFINDFCCSKKSSKKQRQNLPLASLYRFKAEYVKIYLGQSSPPPQMASKVHIPPPQATTPY